jgi:hypothetical protein
MQSIEYRQQILEKLSNICQMIVWAKKAVKVADDYVLHYDKASWNSNLKLFYNKYELIERAEIKKQVVDRLEKYYLNTLNKLKN